MARWKCRASRQTPDRVEEMRGVDAEDIQADGGASSFAAGEPSLV
jgi:hypothetical protein